MENQPVQTEKLSHLESTPPTPSKLSIAQTRKPKTLNLILSLITLTSLSASAYFFYQNQLLEQELASLPLEKQEPEGFVTNSTLDSTTDWLTYTNTLADFSFNYPPELNVIIAPYSNLDVSLTQSPEVLITKDTPDTVSPGGWGGIFLKIIANPNQLDSKQYIETVKKIEIKEEFDQYFPGSTFTPLNIIPWDHDTLDISVTINEPTIGNVDETKHFYIATNKWIIEFGSNLMYYEPIATQILSTFEFSGPSNTSPSQAINSTKSQPTTLTYSLPSGWKTIQSPENAYEIGYDPELEEPSTSPETGNFLFLKLLTGPKSVHSVFKLTDYNGGSRHLYLQEHMDGPLYEGDKLPDFQEVEYLIQGKKCLVYDGYAISMSPHVWGMCPITPQKALFFNLDRLNYLAHLKTIKFL
jgi:hypothetical protein